MAYEYTLEDLATLEKGLERMAEVTSFELALVFAALALVERLEEISHSVAVIRQVMCTE